MPFVLGNAEGDLDFDSLVGSLRDAFPESTVILDDYYRDRLERQREIAKELVIAEDSSLIRCTERVAIEHGTQHHLAVCIARDISLDARTDRSGILASVVKIPLNARLQFKG